MQRTARMVLGFAFMGVAALGCNPKKDEGQRMPQADGGMMADGMMSGMPNGMMGEGPMMDPEMMRDMHAIRTLLMNHERIEREVEDIPGGIRSVTTSHDPELAELIRTHVWQMKSRMEEGRPIRHMDPVFRELFRDHEKVHLQIEEIPGGARVIETSEDPQVTSLIRQHAHRAVSEFVERGMPRAMKPTPLPDGYVPEN